MHKSATLKVSSNKCIDIDIPTQVLQDLRWPDDILFILSNSSTLPQTWCIQQHYTQCVKTFIHRYTRYYTTHLNMVQSTACTVVLASSYHTETVSMTHSGNTCTLTQTFPGSGDWTMTITATDFTPPDRLPLTLNSSQTIPQRTRLKFM